MTEPAVRQMKEAIVDLEGFKVGDTVIARFTSAGSWHQFRGEIVGRTLNYWKVRSLEPVYPGETPGRVFQIYTAAAKQYSMNNRLIAEKTGPFRVVNPNGALISELPTYAEASAKASGLAYAMGGLWVVTNDRGHRISTVFVGPHRLVSAESS